jgi:beta-glucosidase
VRRGGHRRVTFELTPRSFSYWNSRRDRWVVAPGCYGVYVGSSSRDIALRGRLALGGGRCR